MTIYSVLLLKLAKNKRKGALRVRKIHYNQQIQITAKARVRA